MIEIRRFNSDDQQAVRDLIAMIMSDEFSGDAQAYPLGDLDDIENTYGGLGEGFFVALNGNSIVGTIAIKKEDDRTALMRRLFVAPKHRNKKIGWKLIDRALQFCDEVGYQEVIFKTTSRMEGAIAVCQKKGFVQRAKLELGHIELLKFVLLLQAGKKKMSAS